MKHRWFLRMAASVALAVSSFGLTSALAAPKAPRPRGAPTAPAGPRAPRDTGTWTSYPLPSSAAPRWMSSVAISTTDDAWAAGGAVSPNGATGGTAQVYHFDGTSWSAISNTTYLTLEALSLIPGVAGTILVAGDNEGDGTSPGLVETCTVTGLPNVCTRDMGVPAVDGQDEWVSNLYGISALSATDYWAVGGGGGYTPYAEYGVILHHTSGGWNAVPMTQTVPLSQTVPLTGTVPSVHYWGVQMLSDGEGYAVGDGGDATAAGTIVHYSPATGRWLPVDTGLTITQTRNMGPLHAVSFISPNEGWVVGGNLSTRPTILHYNRTASPQWTMEGVATLPAVVDNQTMLWAVDMLADGSGYAAGNDGQLLYRSPISATLGYTVTWRSVYTDPGPDAGHPNYPPLYGLSALPDGSMGWAVGGALNQLPRLLEMTKGALSPVPRQWLPFVSKGS